MWIFLWAGPVWAQSAMPEYTFRPGWSGPGYYLSWPKIAACWLLFLCWVATTDWVNRDLQEKKLDYFLWNPIVSGTFFGAMVLVWLGIPYFWLAFGLLLVAYVGPLTAYILYRNRRVPVDERVLTPDHLRYWFAQRLRMFGVKVEAEKKAAYEKGPPLLLESRGGPNPQAAQARMIAARQKPGFNIARRILAEAVDRRATALLLDFTQQGVAVKHQIDTVWHPADPLSREDGDPALEALKILCGLNPADRQGKQEGQFQARYKEQLYPGTFLSQGVPTGERVILQLEAKTIRFKTLAELGMRDKMQEAIQEVMNRPKGLVFLSAMPSGGLRTTTEVLLKNQDRFLREFLAVEDVQHRYDEIENIPVHTYDSAKGETPASILVKVFRLYPNVLVVRDLVNGETVQMLCDNIRREDRLVVATMRAKDCAEALLRVLALKAPPEDFAACVTGVLNQRLIRKLCEKCKQAYQPTPQVLQQLGFPAGKVLTFYRPPQPTPEQPTIEPCETCGGLGYYGVTGLFEWWTIDDGIRKVLANTPKLDLLRKAAQKAGMRTMQEEGLLLVAKGVTSLQELSRVMKL